MRSLKTVGYAPNTKCPEQALFPCSLCVMAVVHIYDCPDEKRMGKAEIRRGMDFAEVYGQGKMIAKTAQVPSTWGAMCLRSFIL